MWQLNEIYGKHIAVSALNWGAGHLNRLCAIIQQLKEHNHIVIFSEKSQSAFYLNLFPDIEQVILPESNINFYPESVYKNFIKNIPVFFQSIKNEKKYLEKFLQDGNKKINLIISDNRYGFFNKQIKSIFITHQWNMHLPCHLKFLNYIHHTLMKNFDEIWIMDYEEDEKALAGKLSRSRQKNYRIKYILPQSVMKKKFFEKEIDYLFIISGTKSEKKFFEQKIKKIIEQLLHQNSSLNIKVIGSSFIDKQIFSGWKSIEETNEMMLKAKNIITRAGYSTLMDLHKIMDEEQNLFLLRSKNQFEQQYLYEYWIAKGWAREWKE